MLNTAFHRARGWLPVVIAVFLITATLSFYLVWRSEQSRQAQRRAEVSVMASIHANAIESNLERALSSTYALAALVRSTGGEFPDFEATAEQMLPYYQGASALALAPDGIIRRMVPLAGNEKAIGHNLLRDPARDKEAFRARDTGKLTLAGPFELVQGGVAAAGRLPVFLPDPAGKEQGKERFWGLISVLIRFPDNLASANLPELVQHGYDYELSRIHPDTGRKQIIATSASTALHDPVEQAIVVPNSTWTLSVAPRGGWNQSSPLSEKVLVSLLISAILAALAHAMLRLGRQQAELETRVRERTRELAESEQKLLSILEGVEAFIYIKDCDYRYQFANRPVRELFSASMEDIIGADDSRFFDAATAARLREIDRRVIEQGETLRVEETNTLHADGSLHTYWSVKLPLRDKAGRIYALCGISTDITERKTIERTTVESEARYHALFADNTVVMLLIDPSDGRIVDANMAASRYYGYPLTTLTGMKIGQINTLDPEQIAAEMQRARDSHRSYFEFRHRLSSGDVRDVLVSSGPIVLNNRTVLLSTVQDVTEQKKAQRAMREALVVFNSSSQGIMITNAHGIIKTINPAFSTITGYTSEEAVGQKPAMFKSDRHDPAFYDAMWSALAKDGRWEGEIWNRRKNGELYPQWLSISSVRDPQDGITEYVALFSDITERKQQEEVIWRQANFDALTGLANRNLLTDRLERALAESRRNATKVGLVFLDLDGFKWINDTLGHDVGDTLLVEVANRLKACIRESDTAARLGGDEFTAIIHGLATSEDMLAVGEKVVSVLRDPFELGGTQHQLSGSVGITIYPDDGEDVQTLLKNADIAMYKAKQAGKNRYQFYARHMQVDARARLQLEVDLRAAIAGNDFKLHYQPIVDADSGELVGAEALIRWEHPERGTISPLDFVPVAEDCGLIVPIGEWVLREAARQWQEWRSRGLPALRMSVNVSGVQFREISLNGLVAGILAEYQIDPGRLMLEITESVLMDGSKEAEERMHQIKALGVGYSLDDFGTGFSSLSYLKRFPIDIVKVDRSFVNDCPEDRNDAHLVAAIINMAHSLDLQVTAEGVETEEQRDFLRDLGCDYLQGYLVGRPLPAAAFEILIERRQLLLPADGASLEESRFLAALRQNELDVDAWLQRLLGERSPELAAYTEERDWTVRGLDLRHAIQAHLDWRRQLDDLVGSDKPIGVVSVENAGAADLSVLGRWLAGQDIGGQECFVRLDHVHREFHRQAGLIANDCARGQRDLARRALAGVRFRKASRDVVVALIDCYQSISNEPEGPA